NVSALTGRSVEKVFGHLDRALVAYHTKLGTGEVNRLFEAATTRVHPPSHGGQPWEMYYATPVSTAPPTFLLFANRTLPKNCRCRRYLGHLLRDELDRPGVPVPPVPRKRGQAR